MLAGILAAVVSLAGEGRAGGGRGTGNHRTRVRPSQDGVRGPLGLPHSCEALRDDLGRRGRDGGRGRGRAGSAVARVMPATPAIPAMLATPATINPFMSTSFENSRPRR